MEGRCVLVPSTLRVQVETGSDKSDPNGEWRSSDEGGPSPPPPSDPETGGPREMVMAHHKN